MCNYISNVLFKIILTISEWMNEYYMKVNMKSLFAKTDNSTKNKLVLLCYHVLLC